MGQISFADAEYAGKRKKTRREVFLEEMELVVPWKAPSETRGSLVPCARGPEVPLRHIDHPDASLAQSSMLGGRAQRRVGSGETRCPFPRCGTDAGSNSGVLERAETVSSATVWGRPSPPARPDPSYKTIAGAVFTNSRFLLVQATRCPLRIRPACRRARPRAARHGSSTWTTPSHTSSVNINAM